MPKSSKKQPEQVVSAIQWPQIFSWIQRKAKSLIIHTKPYLAPKFWAVYLLAFGLGFYLWGPSHGMQKISRWKVKQERQTHDVSTVETLRHELNRLKQQLQTEQTKKVEPAFDSHSFSRPALGQIVQGFEWTGNQKSWRLHPGVDIGTPPGSNVMAAAAGTVLTIEKTPEGRFSVTLDHGTGWESVYADLTGVQVQEGQKVIKGVILGTSSPKSHAKVPGFHFGIYHNRQPLDPQNIIEGL
jgi:murein DD-endopeptidase MepM/ murein hydrolase activator NlpD